MTFPTRRGFFGMVGAIPLSVKLAVDNIGRRSKSAPLFYDATEQIEKENKWAGLWEAFVAPPVFLVLTAFEYLPSTKSTPYFLDPAKIPLTAHRMRHGVDLVTEPFDHPVRFQKWKVIDTEGRELAGGDYGYNGTVKAGDTLTVNLMID